MLRPELPHLDRTVPPPLAFVRKGKPGMSRVLTVSGSPKEVSRSTILLGHVSAVLAARGHTIDHLSLRDLPAQALMHADFDDPAIIDSAGRLARADGVVFATPVYKAAYSGLLKTWLDLMPQFALERKIALPLATGGSAAHALALDYALRPVLTSMAAHHVVNGFLVLDQFIEAPTATTPVSIHEDAAPALEKVIDGFLEGLDVARRSAA
jgi:FMN reductase